MTQPGHTGWAANQSLRSATKKSGIDKALDEITKTNLRGTDTDLSPLAKGSHIVFPGELLTSDHFVNFMVSKNYQFQRREVKDYEFRVTLPLPANLQTQYNAKYNHDAVGVVGQAAGSEASKSDGTIGDIANRIGDNWKKYVSTGAKMNVVASLLNAQAGTLAGAAVGSFGGQIGTLLGAAAGAVATGLVKGGQAGLGIAVNPHRAVLFDGPDFRRHSFNYRLVPKNARESRDLKNLIHIFKQAMLPAYIHDKHFFNYPRQFDIDIPLGSSSEKSPFVHDIKASVLTAFNVNYHATGPHYHEAGGGLKAPVAVDISMEFLEITVTTRDDTEDDEMSKFQSANPAFQGLLL